jgi:hypothetical protein
MTNLIRFGRKIALPSTRQIRHELVMLMREDERLKEAARKKAAENLAIPPVDG